MRKSVEPERVELDFGRLSVCGPDQDGEYEVAMTCESENGHSRWLTQSEADELADAIHSKPCLCGVAFGVSHYCSARDHCWVGKKLIQQAPKGCPYHVPAYPAGCPDCAQIATTGVEPSK